MGLNVRIEISPGTISRSGENAPESGEDHVVYGHSPKLITDDELGDDRKNGRALCDDEINKRAHLDDHDRLEQAPKKSGLDGMMFGRSPILDPDDARKGRSPALAVVSEKKGSK